MNTAVINIKTQPEIKAKAQKIAKTIGVSLSSLLNAYLKQFIKTKTVTFSAREDEIPNEYFKRTLAKARKNWKEGKGSPVFHTGEEAVKWLEEQGI
ncbi:type II toxin-antitoxin system RelB/DinJ family antitoxin [Candidatus Roizmanbacteria bacterium]|nr:type II toxin-antitoxin system RelB/DinJ family antitoxin [Candidatus Roizmanbacteria bacterium]